jgi:hypothetical protein
VAADFLKNSKQFIETNTKSPEQFSKAGHSLLFPLFAIRSSATSTPLFAIATPLLF